MTSNVTAGFHTSDDDEGIVLCQKNLNISRFIHLSHTPFFSIRLETKGKGRREQQQQHKKLLAAMLSQDSFDSALHSSVSSVAEEEMEDEDDAMELLGKLLLLPMSYVSMTRELPHRHLCCLKMWHRPANHSRSASLYMGPN